MRSGEGGGAEDVGEPAGGSVAGGEVETFCGGAVLLEAKEMRRR